MNVNDLIKGELVLFYIKVDTGFLPVCALTNNPFTRTTGRLETTGRGSGGYRSYLPTIHDYTISLEGILTKEEGVVSWSDLDELQENNVIFEWMIASDDNHIMKQGKAFIDSLAVDFTADEYVTFSCNLAPALGGIMNLLLWSQDGFNVVTQNGNNEVQVK